MTEEKVQEYNCYKAKIETLNMRKSYIENFLKNANLKDIDKSKIYVSTDGLEISISITFYQAHIMLDHERMMIQKEINALNEKIKLL